MMMDGMTSDMMMIEGMAGEKASQEQYTSQCGFHDLISHALHACCICSPSCRKVNWRRETEGEERQMHAVRFLI